MSNRWLTRIVAPLVVLAAGIAFWQWRVEANDTPSWFLPSPRLIGRTLIDDRGLLADNAWVTLREVLIGFAIALLAGILIALLIHISPILERAIYPIVIASQAVPLVALAPLLLVWFGYGLTPKVIVTALVAFFPITVGAVDGLRSADRETLNLLRSYGASRVRRFWMVNVPSALPSLFSGARIGISIAVIGAVFGEYVGANSGLGYLMNISAARLQTERVFAAIGILAVMAITLFGLVALVERRALRWRRYVTEE
jgi:ABC-type nitrate/sulfonate/bicarbonate transport system permease component